MEDGYKPLTLVRGYLTVFPLWHLPLEAVFERIGDL
jgi:hypothetical protein